MLNSGEYAMQLTRDQIISAIDAVTKPIDVPEWGGVIHVRVISAAERDSLEAAMQDRVTRAKNIRARIVALCACNPAGERLFTDEDAEALGKKSGIVMDRLFDAAMEINGMLPDSVEDAEKN